MFVNALPVAKSVRTNCSAISTDVRMFEEICAMTMDSFRNCSKSIHVGLSRRLAASRSTLSPAYCAGTPLPSRSEKCGADLSPFLLASHPSFPVSQFSVSLRVLRLRKTGTVVKAVGLPEILSRANRAINHFLGQPVAEVVISSAKRSGWDWLLHPHLPSFIRV
jgi:hypothetical protein